MNKDIIGYVQMGFSALSIAKNGFNIFRYIKKFFSIFRANKKIKTSKLKFKKGNNFILNKRVIIIIKKYGIIFKNIFLIIKERFY